MVDLTRAKFDWWQQDLPLVRFVQQHCLVLRVGGSNVGNLKHGAVGEISLE